MPKCSIKSCKNITSRALKKDGISYFRFPRDPIKCAEWISVVSQERRQEFFMPNNSSVVCSEHFLDKDKYVTEKGIIRLLKTAVPNIVIEIPDDNSEVSRTSATCDLENMNKFKSSTIFPNIKTIFETPREAHMKRQLTKLRKRLINKEKIIASLRKKNSRLGKRKIVLKNAVIVLKKRLRLFQQKCRRRLSPEVVEDCNQRPMLLESLKES